MSKPAVSPEPILKMATGYWVSKILSATVQLDIFTHIAQGKTKQGDLGAATGVSERPLKALLNAGVALGLLAKEGDKYGNTPMTDAFLVKGKPSYFGDMVVMQGSKLYDVWSHLEETIKSGTPPKNLFNVLRDCPETAATFTAAMHNNAVGTARHLAEKVDCSGFHALMDLGGGSGAYSLALTERYPQLNAYVVEFCTVCKVADEYIQRAGLTDRVSTVAADMVSGKLPSGCDLALLSQVLHSFGDEECRKILGNSFAALENGGMIIVNEFFLNEDEAGPVFSAIFSVNMLLESDRGASYSTETVRTWLGDTGFEDVQYIGLPGPSALLTARKP